MENIVSIHTHCVCTCNIPRSYESASQKNVKSFNIRQQKLLLYKFPLQPASQINSFAS